MERRVLGRTGIGCAVIGFGCGSVGGLMVRGEPAEQERAVARAIERGIDYFDTAAQYGDGRSETNLGRVLRALRADVRIATKVKVPDVERGKIGAAIAAALDQSLARLGRDHVDLYQLHNVIVAEPKPGGLTPAQVLEDVVPAMIRLREAGKLRHFGMTALGETAAMMVLVEARVFATAQMPLNLLNPSPMRRVARDYPAQDYDCMLDRMTSAGMSGIGIRIMAGGAIGGGAAHKLARGDVGPMGSGSSFAADMVRAKAFDVLVAEGHADSTAHAAIRYVMASPAIGPVLIGASDAEQVEDAVRAAAQGPLSAIALQRVTEIQDSFAGQPR
jgi:aryl-alcohol dehydrogenase-like predicted oxidoreductase